MNQGLKSDALSRIMQLLYIVFFICLAFAFNYFSTVSIGLILVAGLIKNRIEGKPLFHPGIKNLFLISCILFYVIQIFSLLYTQNKEETFVHLRIKCALVFLPLALCSSDYLNDI